MPRRVIHGAAALLIAVAALLIIRMHRAAGAAYNPDSVAAGHRFAGARCTACHAIDSKSAGTASAAPDFPAIANQASTTELSLKVFLRSNQRNMPNPCSTRNRPTISSPTSSA
jgi:mono/diheme cytochrome c family protein